MIDADVPSLAESLKAKYSTCGLTLSSYKPRPRSDMSEY